MAKSLSKDTGSTKKTFRESFNNTRSKVWAKKSSRLRPHKSFRRSYREDYVRELEAPGLLAFTVYVFKTLFKNWKFFACLLVFALLLNTVLVGLMDESTYQTFQATLEETDAYMSGTNTIGNVAKAGLVLISTIATGGLSTETSAVQQVFAVLIFVMIWLVVIFALRHFLAGNRPKFRDALYNALTPFISTLFVVLTIFIQLIPVLIVIIAYSAAQQTEFLATPFYALVFFVCAVPLILLSIYLLSSSLIALVAVSAPGMYPMVALTTASNLQQGRRVRFVIRVLFLFFVLVVIWALIMIPIILLDQGLKSAIGFIENWPIVSIFLNIMTCFSFIFITAYIYLYYRRLLDDPN